MLDFFYVNSESRSRQALMAQNYTEGYNGSFLLKWGD